ncbi:hypothetical protein [Streptomyces sp. Rer75]|uniref:hypothetical protein n=1 Tax=Streptomyces sp. Rer75 TaxID=2750011 RepID=UPI0015CFE4E0|nr:hypothetical protein [Streptomyces sp. Rer75]QLH20605.1 hypothetical protein HYQ63_08150 [Streptomyces sp. Rer75]
MLQGRGTSHTYQIGTSGPRKNTAIALPKKILSVFFDTANRAGVYRTATAHTTARPK